LTGIDGLHAPHRLAGLGVERDQPSVERADDHLAIGHGEGRD
jgi:hypothetical protein